MIDKKIITEMTKQAKKEQKERLLAEFFINVEKNRSMLETKVAEDFKLIELAIENEAKNGNNSMSIELDYIDTDMRRVFSTNDIKLKEYIAKELLDKIVDSYLDKTNAKDKYDTVRKFVIYADMQLGNALRETDHNNYLYNIYIKGDNSCSLVRQYLHYRIITDKLKDYIEEGYNIRIIPTENKIKVKW